MSEAYMRQLFDTPARKIETEISKKIKDTDLGAEIGDPRPIGKFIAEAKSACGAIFKTKVVQSAPVLPAPNGSHAEAIHEFVLTKADYDLGKLEPDDERAVAEEVVKKFPKSGQALQFRRYVQATDLPTALQRLLDHDVLIGSANEVVQKFTDRFRGAQAKPEPEDWQQLAKLVNEYLDRLRNEKPPRHPEGCSLIYCYYLDEGGVQFAIERLADRIENGVIRTTAPLRELHVRENSIITDIISTFIGSWQGSEILDVDSRRKQYHALYGFPLHAARSWGRMHTVDPRQNFPAALHGFFYEAHRYYRDTRNLEMLPDIETVRAALKRLLQALREGNENFRLRRLPQIRGQIEYVKRLLGGIDPANEIAAAWDRHLTGRPGVEGASDSKPWQHKVDAVASAYAWRRPSMTDYLALAESGEEILIAVRVAGEAGVFDDDSAIVAFLNLIKEPGTRYANAFKSVAAVDLTQNTLATPPSAAMARHIQAPGIPPMKWNWAARVPRPAS